MSWAPIIAALIAALAPIIEQLLLAWLGKRLKEEAAGMDQPHIVAASEREAQLALLGRVRDSLWFFQFAKRRAVDAAIKQVKNVG